MRPCTRRTRMTSWPPRSTKTRNRGLTSLLRTHVGRRGSSERSRFWPFAGGGQAIGELLKRLADHRVQWGGGSAVPTPTMGDLLGHARILLVSDGAQRVHRTLRAGHARNRAAAWAM